MTVSLEQVKELLDYDPLTGEFFWKTSTRGHRAGERAGYRQGAYANSDGGYRYIRLMGQNYLEHRLAWLIHYGEWPAMKVDHRDRVRDNNRIRNLRLATNSQNSQNACSKRDSASAFRGVSKYKDKWRVQIRRGCGDDIYLGTFVSEIDAARAYDDSALRHHGEFACLNFGEDLACAA